jgi:hypothetical protein
MDSEPNLLVRACNQLGQFLQHRETNLRYLALESMCLLATSEFSHDAVKKHQDTVINALKVYIIPFYSFIGLNLKLNFLISFLLSKNRLKETLALDKEL